MISFGKNIRQANDPLNKISVETVFNKITTPHQKLIDYIKQLRTVATIDAKKYRQLKVKLPYLVAATFNPAFRKKDCFAHTSYFIIDIDHINEKELDLNTLFNKITNDKRVVLAFRSPSNDGIKLFFKLDELCYDSGKYSLFYKLFAQKFSTQYNLSQVIDKTTSDVSRACFVSYDPNAYFNPNADEIDMGKFLNFENEEQITELKIELKKTEKIIKEKNSEKEKNKLDTDKQDIPLETLREIREKLNPKLKTKREKNIYIPEELNNIIDSIKQTMATHNINTSEIKNINYGKQFKFTFATIWTEINLFYGKKGFTIVKTTKNNSNTELADTCVAILENLLY